MKKILTILSIFLLSISASNAAENVAPAWKIDQSKSKIEFKVAQDSSNISGSFKKFSGKINFDPAQLKTSTGFLLKPFRKQFLPQQNLLPQIIKISAPKEL
jgi:polyisoprenoid-binding protein YceI